MSVIYENADFLVMAKPAGSETVSQTGEADFLAAARRETGEPGLVPAHRLDRDTSGAVLLARTAAAEKKLTALFRQRLMRKTYFAICLGSPRNETGSINRRLSEWSGGRRPVRVLRQGGLEASTEYRVAAASDWLAEDFRLSLIVFRPHQGRTHQIRVHAAAIGYPVIGDDQYGDREANRTAKRLLAIGRQALHSARLEFEWNGETVNAVCPFEKDMREASQKMWPGREFP